MCTCNRTPEDEEDLDMMMCEMDHWYEQEREIINRAEAQQPDWYKTAMNLCLPSLAFTAQMEPVR